MAKSALAALRRDLAGREPADILRDLFAQKASTAAAKHEREEAERNLATLVQTAERLETEAETLRPLSKAGLLISDRSVRNWLVKGFKPEVLGAPFCVTVGSGPFDLDDFDRFLQRRGYEVYPTGVHDIDIMVVGRENWSEEALEEQLAAREGSTLRVYSQVMFIAAMSAWRDPFESAAKTILAFGRGHPALEYLRDSALEWPGTEAVVDYLGEFTSDGASLESPLHNMGYVVGITYGVPLTSGDRCTCLPIRPPASEFLEDMMPDVRGGAR